MGEQDARDEKRKRTICRSVVEGFPVTSGRGSRHRGDAVKPTRNAFRTVLLWFIDRWRMGEARSAGYGKIKWMVCRLNVEGYWVERWMMKGRDDDACGVDILAASRDW